MSTQTNCVTPLLLSFFLLATTSIAVAQNDESQPYVTDKKPSALAGKPWPVSKLSVRLGSFWAINTTTLGAGINGKEYESFQFENAINMNRNTYSGLLNFNWRLGKHNRLDFTYYTIFRNSTVTLAKDISFGEHTYPVNSTIKAHLNTNVLRLSYGYAFISSRKLEVGALAGFHVMFFNTGIDLRGETLNADYNDNVNFLAPLPDVGLWGTYAFADRWAVSTELSYFYVKYNNLTGRVLNVQLSLQYKLSKHWEIDLGYTDFDVRVDLDRKYLKADFEWNYNGPFITGIYRFGN